MVGAHADAQSCTNTSHSPQPDRKNPVTCTCWHCWRHILITFVNTRALCVQGQVGQEGKRG